ncbi:hypothetical protein KBB68_02890 [Candidatus Babeliales bacterium]|nr:hypothetical protein [Candidatus Babeliales bacterium]
MIKRSQQFLIFLTLFCNQVHSSNQLSENTEYSRKTVTPHPSNHSDETRSSSLEQSDSTAIENLSSQSLTPSPEPQNPEELDLQEICAIINIHPATLLERAKNLTGENENSQVLRVIKKLLKFGLQRIVSVKLASNDETGAPICYKPTQIIIHDSFWTKNSTLQDILLAQVVHRLNNRTSEIQILAKDRLTEENINPEKCKELQKNMELFCAKLDKDAIKMLIARARDTRNNKKIVKLQKYLLANEIFNSEEPCESKSSNADDTEEPCESEFTQKKRSKKDSFIHQ